MPSFKSLMGVVVGLVAITNALPALPKISERSRARYDLVRRQAAATAAASGLNDVDILQFALTLENLETAFYEQGFAQFSASDFAAAGLTSDQVTNLISIGNTEQVHVTTLLTAITGAGQAPVQPCTYNFSFTDAASMIATASTLENIGVSAYLGAAPLINSSAVLSVAAQIVTVESRHQTFIRTVQNAAAVPSAFDTPLGPTSVFTLAASFITSCPTGSLLAITPFTPFTLSSGPPPASGFAITPISAGTSLAGTTTASGAAFCSFTNGGVTIGGTAFTPFVNGACDVPQNLFGETYVHLTSANATVTGVLTDDLIVAGPVVIAIS